MNIFRNKITAFWVLCLAISFLLLANIEYRAHAAEEEPAQEEEIDKEAVEEAEEKIEKYEKKLDKETEVRDALQQNVNQIQYSINNVQSEINKTEGLIDDTEETISRKEKEIELLGEKMEFQKVALKSLARELYYSKKESEINIVFNENSYIKIFSNIDSLQALEEKTLSLMDGIRDSKTQIDKDKEGLKSEKSEHEKLLVLKESQQQTLAGQKSQVQSKVNEKEATINELRGKLSKLQRELSGLLGESYDTDDILEAAKIASKATGVRKDFILGMLVVESNLGRFTGGCNYKESRMSDYRKGIFKTICKELDYDYKKMKVSCPPANYSGTGGAMGVAQFMSDTWMGYKSQIAAATGHSTPDPWSLIDGVTAMALKLGNDGARSKSGECRAAMRYLGGSHQWYCDQVLYWADNYEKKL